MAFSISPYVENMRLTPDAAAEAKIGARKMRQKIRIAAENEIGVGSEGKGNAKPAERETEGCC